jgi:hypothetical protein
VLQGDALLVWAGSELYTNLRPTCERRHVTDGSSFERSYASVNPTSRCCNLKKRRLDERELVKGLKATKRIHSEEEMAVEEKPPNSAKAAEIMR